MPISHNADVFDFHIIRFNNDNNNNHTIWDGLDDVAIAAMDQSLMGRKLFRFTILFGSDCIGCVAERIHLLGIYGWPNEYSKLLQENV